MLINFYNEFPRLWHAMCELNYLAHYSNSELSKQMVAIQLNVFAKHHLEQQQRLEFRNAEIALKTNRPKSRLFGA